MPRQHLGRAVVVVDHLGGTESLAAGAPGCTGCAASLASASDHGPWFRDLLQEATPVLATESTGASWLATADRDLGGMRVHRGDSGLPGYTLDVGLVGLEPYRLFAIAGPEEPASFWVERGTVQGLPPSWALSEPLQQTSAHNLAKYVAASGKYLCDEDWIDSRSLGARVPLTPMEDQQPVVFGSDLGRLRAAGADCEGWATNPVLAGASLKWVIQPESKALGPHVVQATLRFDVEGFGPVELYEIGYSTGSTRWERPEHVLEHMVHLHIWMNT